MLRSLLVLTSLLIGALSLGAEPPKNEYEEIAQNKNVYEIEEIAVHARSFNFSNINSVSILLSKINDIHPMKDGEAINSYAVLAALFVAQPEACFECLLDNYGRLNVCGRVQLAKALHQTDFQENQMLLRLLLRDKEKLPSERERNLAASRYRGHLRVCDYAYGSFIALLKKGLKRPINFPNQMHQSISIEGRDSHIARLGEWWDKESSIILAAKTSVAANRPAVGVKIRSLQRMQEQAASHD